MSTKEEHQLIANIMGGNQELYSILIDRYKTGLYYHCFRIIKDEDVAEDIAQETFIHAYWQLKHYKPDHAFSTWLYKIATNKAIDYLRRNKSVRLDDEMEKIVSMLPSTEQEAYHQELRDAVHKLPKNYHNVIRMHYWEGKGYEEMAARLQVPVGSIKGWLHRAKRQLKEKLS